LGEFLRNGHREVWLKWLDQNDLALKNALGCWRLVAAAGVLLTAWLVTPQSSHDVEWTRLVVCVIATVVLFSIFGVSLPLVLAVHLGEPILARSLNVLAALNVLTWPAQRILGFVDLLVRRLAGKTNGLEEDASERAEQEILDAVSEGEAHGAVDEEQKEMIESIIHLKETPVSAIMTPRTDIDGVPADCSLELLRGLIRKTGHSRVPVYEDTIDHITGVVYAKDLLWVDPGHPFDARKVMRTVPYVPETKSLDELLEEFRTQKVQIAIVLDEYGGTAGIATIEDILEELVGEIDDEYDQRPPPAINRVDDNTLEVDARVSVSEINAALDVELPEEEDYETIGGFVFATLGKVPAAGEEFTHENVRFQIVSAEPRKINRLRIHVQRQEQTA
jgi:CBS domain containing-hemolysin-like protein